MGIFDSTELDEHETPAVRDLFNRIVEAEADKLTEEQRANPRAYLIDAWHEAAEAVMRPIQKRVEVERELARFRDKLGETDLPF